MKNYKQILEAIHRGINLALDDFDDYDLIGQQTLTIKDTHYTKEYLEWEELIQKFKNGVYCNDIREYNQNPLTSRDTLMLPIFSRMLGIKYTVHDRAELLSIIKYIIGFHTSDGDSFTPGVNPHENLNWLDVSNITNMEYLFVNLKFNGEISDWDVSNVNNMKGMFLRCTFSNDISKWDVSNVTEMAYMFRWSNFNNNISNWNYSNVKSMYCMFYGNEWFEQDLSNWVISSSKIDADHMFYMCKKMNGRKDLLPKFIK